MGLLRALQRYLVYKTFARGRKRRKCSHVKDIIKNCEATRESRIKEIYPDENYVHRHYSRSEFLLFDPFDDLYEEPRRPHKGRRYWICAAIEHDSVQGKTDILRDSV